MNAERRKALEQIKSKLEGLKAELETLQSEEEAYYDAMPESLQNGEKGTASTAAFDALTSADSSMDDVISSIEEAAGV